MDDALRLPRFEGEMTLREVPDSGEPPMYELTLVEVSPEDRARQKEALRLMREFGATVDDGEPEPTGTEKAGHVGWLFHGHETTWNQRHVGLPRECPACAEARDKNAR